MLPHCIVSTAIKISGVIPPLPYTFLPLLVFTQAFNKDAFIKLFNVADVKQKVILTSSGAILTTTLPLPQIRSLPSDKTNLFNYLEDENYSPLDDVFTKTASNNATMKSTIAISISENPLLKVKFLVVISYIQY